MTERLIILSESEVREALHTYLDCSVKELEDNIVEALVLYSSPGRINKHETKCAGGSVSVKKDSNIPLDMIKEELLYSLADEIQKELILLKEKNSGDMNSYLVEMVYRFNEDKPGYEVVDTDADNDKPFFDNWEGKVND